MTRIFISHSHLDENIADLLIDFLTESIEIPKTEIRCTSDPNHGLDFSSSSISDQLKNDLSNAGALIVIATVDSLRSPWVLFEVGSFWTTDKLVAPIIGPGLILENLPGPLKGYRSIRIEDDDVSYQLKEFIRQLEDKLNLKHNLGTRRSDKKLEAFIDEFRAWKSQFPDLLQQGNVEDLRQKVEEIETKSRQEKQELEKSLQSQIRKLEQQLEQEKSQNNQTQKIKLVSQREQKRLEQKIQDYKTQISQLEQELGSTRSQIAKQNKEIKRLMRQKKAVAIATQINRRSFLKWAGLGSAGLITAIVAREIFKIPVVKLESFEFETVTVDQTGEIIIEISNKQAEFFKEDLSNGVILEMVSIPGGKFMMGTEDEEIERLVKKFDWEYFRREKPQHEVIVQPFFLGKYPITQAQYHKVMGENPSYFKGNNLPVENVFWNNAVEFCQRLSQKTGREYRLPTEAEWEYAARAGTKTPFHFGATITTDLANYDGNYIYASEPKGKYRAETTTVGTFTPNAFGLYNMHGNVWEWCQDNWHKDYQGAPKDGTAWVSGSYGVKVIRGGSWRLNPSYCRSASRNDTFPRFANDYFTGFRVVCVVPQDYISFSGYQKELSRKL